MSARTNDRPHTVASARDAILGAIRAAAVPTAPAAAPLHGPAASPEELRDRFLRVLAEVGGFERIWGEDLELTFRLHRHRKRIVFDPSPTVLAECPATPGALWRQRVRWVRSYLKIALRHRDLFFRRRHWPFSLYLPINFASMALVPLLQAALVVLLPVAAAAGWIRFRGPLDLVAWLGLGFFLAVALYSILLDRAPTDTSKPKT